MRRECQERFSRCQLKRKPLVNSPGMHHDTCVTYVPWCMSGSLTHSGGQNVPVISGAWAILRIWQEARGWRWFIWFQVYISWYIWQMVKFPGSIIWHGCRLYIWYAIWRGGLRQFGSLFGKNYSRSVRFAYMSFSGTFFRVCHDMHGFVSKKTFLFRLIRMLDM